MLNNITLFDTAWIEMCHAHLVPALSLASWGVSNAFWAGLGWWIVILILLIKRQRRLPAQIALALIIALLCAELLKHLAHRLRPCELYPQYLNMPLPSFWDSRFSFPSTHACLCSAAAFVLLLRKIDIWSLLALLISIMVGLSRIYLGVHWPSDVLAGWALGAVAGAISFALFRFTRSKTAETNVQHKEKK